MSKDKIKILHILPNLDSGCGDAVVIKNYFEKIDKNKFEFSLAYFIQYPDAPETFIDYFKNNGCNLFKFDRLNLKNSKKVINQLTNIIKESNCNIIHLHFPVLHYFVKKAIKNVKDKQIKLIINAHSTKHSNSLKRSIRNKLMCLGVAKKADKLLACSHLAGLKMLGRKFNKTGEILYNAMDLNKFQQEYSKEELNKLKKELNLKDEKVYIHIGRMHPEKNQKFVVEVFKDIIKKEPNAVLLFVGFGGKLVVDEIKNLVSSYNLNDKVKFLGLRKDVNKLLKISDTLIFPSLYEGLGLVLIEAQLAKVQCFASTGCPIESKISNIIEYTSLNKGSEFWANKILETEKPKKIEVNADKYDINKQVSFLENTYKNLLK